MGLPDGIAELLPLTPAQRGMLFHIVEGADTGARYVAVVQVSITGALDVPRLKRAFQDTVNAHQALRACFIWENVKEPVQPVYKSVDVPFEILDWSDDPDRPLEFLIERERLRTFDLTKPPLMTAKLVRHETQRHTLVWTVQHLISDGWSLGVVLDETFARYHGRPVPRAAQFRDYLIWLKKQKPEASDSFWEAHLDGFSPVRLDLPAEADPHGESVQTITLTREITERCDTLARRLRITQNTLLASVWALTLRIVTRSDDVAFGVTSAGRPPQVPDIGSAVGSFINTLPLRQVIDADQSVESFLAAAGELHRARGAHEFSPLARVQGPSGTALFDTLFVHQGVPPATTQHPDLRIGPPEIRQSSNFALAMLARPGDRLAFELIYDEARVAGFAASGVLSVYQSLLEAVVTDPGMAIRDLLPQVPDPSDAGRHDDVVAEFLKQAQSKPGAPAITDGEVTLSYGEVVDRARRIAGSLAEAGLEEGELVPVALPRGATCVVAFVGIMMAGGVYVPIDLGYPRERIAQVLDVVRPRMVIAHADTELPVPVRIIEPNGATPIAEPVAADLAYVIFTSGSQGVPKGVEITRAGLAYSTGMRDAMYNKAPDAFLLLSSLAFDSSVVGIYWTLTTGGHLVIAKDRAEQDPQRLGSLVAQHSVSHLLCVPSLYDALLDTLQLEQLECLTTVIVAGEPVRRGLPARHRSALPDTALFNEYGPTEGTVWCAAKDITQDGAGPVSIGTAPPGTSLSVCDKDGAQLPPGLIGALRLNGPGVARGYFQDPDQTRGSFRNGTYETGDLGYHLPNGDIVLIGREDDQVKIRGHRIELGEIEAAARKFSSSMPSVAVAFGSGQSKRLVLFIRSDDVPEGLEAALAETLPDHARPSLVLAIDELPTLPNGKTDQGRLREIASTRAQEESARPASSSSRLEATLADIWSEVLGIDPPAPDQNFFDIGGDSIKSIALYSLAERRGLKIGPTDIFEHQTISELARHIQTRLTMEVTFQGAAEFKTAHLDGTGMPVLILYANMRLFRNLVNGLGPNHPVGLLFSHHFEGLAPPKNCSVASLAKDAMERLRQIRPTGPYAICGYSAGAAVALEMATQLRKRGEDVSVLSLIDPPYGVTWDDRPDGAFGDFLKDLARRVYYAIRPILPMDKRKRHGMLVNSAYRQAMASHMLQPYSGPCNVQLTPENLAMEPGSRFAAALTNVTFNHLEYDHDDILENPDCTLEVTTNLVRIIRNHSE